MTQNEIAEILKPVDLRSLMIYADLLSHFIMDGVPGQMEQGHSFKMERENSVNGTHTLIAIDSFDGKRYRVTVENI